jgi:hypothetical protein
MNRTALALVPTPPASADAVALLLRGAKEGGRALTMTAADDARQLAARCVALAAMGDAVTPGVRQQASAIATALENFATRAEALA